MRIRGKIKIKNGEVKYIDRFPDLLRKLKEDPEWQDKYGYITVDMKEIPIADSRRNYYYGYLIPPIAEKIGETEDDTHILMKRKFDFYHINNIDEIPERHRDRALLEYELYQDGQLKGIFRAQWYPGFTTPKISTEILLELVGYMQSISTMNNREGAKYVKKVEVWAIDFLKIPIKADAPHVRTDAMREK